ncbi:MAG: carboxy terminal-processing peptidase [gamma proteobacterium symbiont of Phacoides pectinatus]
MRNRLFVRLLLLAVPLWGGVACATLNEVEVDELEPTREQRQAALLTLRLVERYHYKRHDLDDAMSSDILDRYIESLDANRSYFLQRDIDRFEIYRERLDEDLKEARLDPAFDIFKVFRQRVDERVTRALALLEREFDFTQDEAYRFDRSDAPWAVDAAAMDELWRKRVKNDVLSLRLTKKQPDGKKIRETLRKRYESIRRRTNQLSAQDVVQTYLNAYTQTLEPHTAYMSPRVSENFDINMRLSLEGVGAVLRSEDEYTVVQQVVAGGPAGLSGKVAAGDRIVGVGQGQDGEIEDVVGWRLQDVVDRIRGAKGTTVRLRLLPEGADESKIKQISLVRNEIKLEDMAAKRSIIEGLDAMGSLRIGVIDLPTFYRDFGAYTAGKEDFRSTTRDVRRLIKELTAQGVDGIVIDLRGNGGGSLVEATELTGLFIPSGPVVQVKSSDGELEVEQDPDPEMVYGGPLAVLVDRSSASASEIFAGAIQDYRRGIIIGEPTFGKGTVQTLVDLGRYVRVNGDLMGRLRMTMAQFFRVNGGSTQFKGVVPDILFPTAAGSEEHGERGLENALPWARIDAADYLPRKIGDIEECRQRHLRRIEHDPGFDYLATETALLIEARERKVLSLRESQRLAEWERREALRKEKKNRFLLSVGLEPEDDDEVPETHEDLPEEEDPLARIMLNEAARILSDCIGDRSPRAAMAD